MLSAAEQMSEIRRELRSTAVTLAEAQVHLPDLKEYLP
jgi:hypothetical protein